MYRSPIVLLTFLLLLLLPVIGKSQSASAMRPKPAAAAAEAQEDLTIPALIERRIRLALQASGADLRPAIIKTEADYGRLSAVSRADVLYEASFHLQPRYYSSSQTGSDTLHRGLGDRPILYYVGSARTPLALPMVSNLSKALAGEEASYTVNLGILPLPVPGAPDSVRYYAVIERAIESNHSDAVRRFERFQKEFTVKIEEPIPLRLSNEPLAKGLYIVRLENGQVLDFYEDFSRFIEEHIVLRSEKILWKLGKQTISDITGRLSIPYSVAGTAQVRIELLSVVDTSHPLVIVDSLLQPADYLAELDMARFADGPYRYRYTALDPVTHQVLFQEVHPFQKATPVMIMEAARLQPGDTIEVGAKKVDWAARLRSLTYELEMERVRGDRVAETLKGVDREKRDLAAIVDANQRSTIADVHGRVGLASGGAMGYSILLGIEADRPAIAFDVSFGYLYASAPYLSGYAAPTIISRIGTSPKSLGLELSYLPIKLMGGLLEPMVTVGYLGAWSDPVTTPAVSTATLLSAQVGVASEPLGSLHGLGLSLSYGMVAGLGLTPSSFGDWSLKAYVRF